MDPYLESPLLWPDVHDSLANIFREQLAPHLAPKYVAELDTQIIIEQIGHDDYNSLVKKRYVIPDTTITRPKPVRSTVAATAIAPAPLRLRIPMAVPTRVVSVHIRHRETERLVAVIELLLSVNKKAGKKREAYLEKRAAYLDSNTHLIEIDLLRRFPRMPLQGTLPESEYLVVISNAYERPECDVWPIGLREPLPVLPIPLIRPDEPVSLDIGKALRTAYQRARYDLRINYHSPPTPRLDKKDVAWAHALIEQE
jgi:hypothetical protein